LEQGGSLGGADDDADEGLLADHAHARDSDGDDVLGERGLEYSPSDGLGHQTLVSGPELWPCLLLSSIALYGPHQNNRAQIISSWGRTAIVPTFVRRRRPSSLPI